MNALTNAINWEFLNEPLYRWFIFAGAAFGMVWAWEGIIALMH